MCSRESSPVPPSPSTEVKQKKRVKKANVPLSLNDNLHSSYGCGSNDLIDRYVTVDKVDDDKERDGESKAKKAKVDKQNEAEDGRCMYLLSSVDVFKTWKRPEERFISFY